MTFSIALVADGRFGWTFVSWPMLCSATSGALVACLVSWLLLAMVGGTAFTTLWSGSSDLSHAAMVTADRGLQLL